jgi:hypothetical protein
MVFLGGFLDSQCRLDMFFSTKVRQNFQDTSRRVHIEEPEGKGRFASKVWMWGPSTGSQLAS